MPTTEFADPPSSYQIPHYVKTKWDSGASDVILGYNLALILTVYGYNTDYPISG